MSATATSNICVGEMLAFASAEGTHWPEDIGEGGRHYLKMCLSSSLSREQLYVM